MSPRSGMTLLELLVALAIALLVIGVVFSMYQSATRTLATQEAAEAGPATAVRAMEVLARDLSCACAPPDEDACPFLISTPAPANNYTVAGFCTASVAPGDDRRWVVVESVAYRLVAGEEDRGVLLRESVPLAGPGSEGPAVTNVLADRVEAFELRVYDGLEWEAEWGSGGLPQAARIAMASGGRSYTVDVLVAASQRFTSSVTRAATPAP